MRPPGAALDPPARAFPPKHALTNCRAPLVFSFVLFLTVTISQALLPHDASDAGNRRVLSLLQRCDHVGLILLRPVLTELEFPLEPGGCDLKTNNIAQHLFTECRTRFLPLQTVFRFEDLDQAVKDVL